MWRPWSRSPVRTSSTNFAFSSFKDIESICSEDSNPGPKTPILRRLPSICHRLQTNNKILRAWSIPNAATKTTNLETATASKSDPPISLPGTESRIVVYYTSLRAIRPTFEACKAVLAILQAFRVQIDERDLSMDSSFLSELKQILNDQNLTLPRVFIGGRYVGGADEVKQLHECGELKKIVGGLPMVEGEVCQCQACGGFRFLLCGECWGSRKIYTEKGGGFRSCTLCNENGLVRCPACSFQSPLLNISTL
ncbi:unnamed protein product [Rhodiola kirilowii]